MVNKKWISKPVARIALTGFMFLMVLPIILSMCSTAHAAETAPSAYNSLQPFKQFAEGTGHGMAREYVSRNKTEFVALLRSPGKLRVDCERLVGQMAEIHKLPFENCEGAAAEIARNSDYEVVTCRSGMFDRDNRLTVTNSNGSAFGFWQRECLVGETVLVYKSRPIASTMCANVAIPVSPVPQAPLVPITRIPLRSTPVATATCPKGIVLFANGWTMDAIYASSNDLGKRVQALIAAATKRDSENASNIKAYMANDVSGGNIGDGVSENIGDEIIRVVNVRAPLGIAIQVNLLDPVTLKVVEDLGQVPLVDGIAKIYLTEAQRAYIVETIWPAWFSSPTVSGGERRIWVPPGAWNKKGGKNWHWCTLQENAAYWKANRPQ